MSTRLQSVITKVVHANQYGFIKGRNIQDCLAWAFQFLHICHKSKREIVILKLDFDKAFDMVEQEVIISMLRHKGFSEKWVRWVQVILSSGTSQVLLNGVPGKSVRCKRGVRQGDPLSPLLFMLAVDLLQSIVNKAFQANILKHPLSKDFGQDYPIVQYADDTLVILPADAVRLWTLKSLICSFADSTGLKVNYNKSFLVPVNVENEKATHLARTIGYQVAEMPFTYLGLPFGTTRPAVEDFLPFLNRIERRMLGLNRLLSYQGKLILVNSILSALPTFYMCSLKMPISILDQADKCRKHSFWNRGDVNRKGGCLVAWKKATRPKNQGGLGVIDLRAHNKALLLKFLHKFYNKANISWVQLTWKDLYTRPIPPHHRKKCGFLLVA
jgi:hypothetical protein